MKIEGILLDLDNTVYDYRTAHVPALAETVSWLAKKLGRPVEQVERAFADSRARVNAELHGLASSHSRLLYFQGVCEIFGQWPCEIALEAEDLYWSAFFLKMELRPGCLAFLKAVRPRPIAIVTDLTAAVQFAKLTRLGLQDFVQVVVTSEEVGKEKPHGEIFIRAAAKLGLEAEHLCMIGDSWERDIVGAHCLGMPCFWYKEEDGATGVEADCAKAKKFSHFSELITLVDACG
ncbi:MAG: HAD family hydrolase [Cyanobacteria bacterium REEB67]|nr:HAD family hydrolase [Cyanobacteria bacterium REEB67]